MKKIFSFLSVLLLLLATTNFSSSQVHFIDGYVVKNNGDTLSGMIYYNGKSVPEQICVFKRFDIAKPIKYSTEDIKAYGFKNGNQFEAKDIIGEKLFVECLVKGNINLYVYGSRFFIEKNNRRFMELRTRPTTVYTWKGEFTYENYKELLAAQTDDKKDYKLPENISLDAEKLIPAIVAYNSLDNGSYKVIERNINPSAYKEAMMNAPVKMTSFGVVLALNTNSTEINPIIRNNNIPVLSVQNRDWSFGAYIGRKVSRNPKALTIVGEIQITKKTEEYAMEYPRIYPTENQSFVISSQSTHLKIPVYAQYNFTAGKLIPFANAGLALNYRMVNSMKGTLKTVDNQNQTNYFEIDNSKFKETNNRLSAFVGVGIKQKIFGSIDLSIESRIELMAYYHAHYPDVIINNYEYYEFKYLYSPKVEIAQCSPLINFILRIGL